MQFRRAIGIILFAIVSGGAMGATECSLRLMAMVDGKAIPVVGVGHNRVIGLRGVDRIPVSLDGKFLIEGDVRRNADYVYWSPYQQMVCAPVRDGVSAPRPRFMIVSVAHDEKSGTVADRLWPIAEGEAAVVILAWATRESVKPRWVKTFSDPSWFDVSELVPVRPEDESGAPVVLFWHDGRFIASNEKFPGEMASVVFDAILERQALRPGFWEPVASPKTIGPHGVGLLHYAAEAGNVSAVRELLARGASLEIRSRNGGTALDWAANGGQLGSVQALLAAMPAGEAIKGRGDLLVSTLRYGHDAVTRLLLERDPAGIKRGTYANALPHAIDRGFADLAEALRSRGADFDFKLPEAQDALVAHAERGNTELVRWLLEHGVKPRDTDSRRTALVAAAARGTRRMAELLCAAGARPGQADPDGLAPLTAACTTGNVSFAEVLLEQGADPNVVRPDGRSALGLALTRSLPLTELLLRHGARLDDAGWDGMKPLEIALAGSSSEFARLLSAHGARVDLKSAAGARTMAAVFWHDQDELLKRAIEDGWDPRGLFFGRWTAVDMSLLTGAERCEKILRAAGIASSPRESAGFPAEPVESRPESLAQNLPPDSRGMDERSLPGEITLRVLVDEDGNARLVRVEHCSHLALAAPAVEIVSGWKFRPASAGGKPVPAWTRLRIAFPPATQALHSVAILDVAPMVVNRSSIYLSPAFSQPSARQSVRVSYIIDATGKVEAATFPDRVPPNPYDLSRWLHDATFTPGMIDGRCVRTKMDLWMRY